MVFFHYIRKEDHQANFLLEEGGKGTQISLIKNA